jgi:signal transduction histidine kinase
LELIFAELCANAAKFHPQRNPKVQVSVRPQGGAGMARIEFMDDGVHLAPEELLNVWRPYFQAERKLTGEVPGVGLGLPLLAALVVQLGGTYDLANCPDHAGLVVSFSLPWSPGPALPSA